MQRGFGCFGYIRSLHKKDIGEIFKKLNVLFANLKKICYNICRILYVKRKGIIG